MMRRRSWSDNVVAVGLKRVFVDVRLVNQGNVVDHVIDEKLWGCHEFVDGVPGFRPLHTVIEGATENFHHLDLYGVRWVGMVKINREREDRGWWKQTENWHGEGDFKFTFSILTHKI